MSSITEPEIKVEAEERRTTETSTANRDVLLEEVAQIAQSPAPGIFIAARPVRKRHLRCSSRSHGADYPSKPFVWIPEGSGEE